MASLPVPGLHSANRMPQRRTRRHLLQPTIEHPPRILPPSDLTSIEAEISPADVVVLADLGAAEAGEVGHGLVGARAVQAERDGMIDPHHLVVGVQAVPASGLVGVDR